MAKGKTMSDIVITKRACDIVQEVSAALVRCKDGDVLRFEPGEYHFWPEQAFEKYYYISNNRHGLKRVAFPIIGKKNITIDRERPFYSQGIGVEDLIGTLLDSRDYLT